LKLLAADETLAGNWTNAAGFPKGTRLYYSDDDDPISQVEILVDLVTNYLTIDASDIITFVPLGSGIEIGGNQPDSSQAYIGTAEFSYNATPVGGTNNFGFTGISTQRFIAGHVSKQGYYVVACSLSIQDGTGEGVDGEGNPILIVGGTAYGHSYAVEETGGLGGFGSDADKAKATTHGQSASPVFVSGTLITQGKWNAGESAYGRPSNTAWSTGPLLKQLAIDEYTAGLWTNFVSTNKIKFPAGSRLMLSTNGFSVLLTPTSSLSISNIIRLSMSGTNVISYTERGIQTSLQLATFSYDATQVGGTAQYSISGLACTKQTKGTMLSLVLQHGVGQGANDSGTPIGFSGVTFVVSKAE
jgi:hypothetical protein